MSIWFTSDTHFSHHNIIKYCDRPFSNVNEMNETIINNWNKVVGKDDVVYHLGDFIFERKDVSRVNDILNRLNGTIHLIIGSHDKGVILRANFASMHDIREIKIGNTFITLCHYSMRVWSKSHYGSWMLYGHSHGKLKDDLSTKSFDVGVDKWNFTPISFEQVENEMKKRI